MQLVELTMMEHTLVYHSQVNDDLALSYDSSTSDKSSTGIDEDISSFQLLTLWVI